MQLAQAQTIPTNPDTPASFIDLEILFGNIIQVVLGLAALVLFIMLLVGGFRWITAGGDPKAVASAKSSLTLAIIGMVLIASAYLILRLIGTITGVDLNNFTIIGS